MDLRIRYGRRLVPAGLVSENREPLQRYVEHRFACGAGLIAAGERRERAAAVMGLLPTRKKDEIAVGVANDEGASAPWFCLERLMKGCARSLKLEEERICVVERNGC